MPRTSCRLNRPATSDVMQASITQLNRLPAAILRLHLSTHHLVCTGTKAMMARRLYESIHQAPPQQTTTSLTPATMLPTSTPVTTMPTMTPETTTPTTTQTSTIPNVYPTGSLPEASQQCIALFPQLVLLLNQFICHATSGQAAPSGQTVPTALSPVSIDGNINSQVMAAHQQLQPSITACQPSAIVTASAALPPAVAPANSASPASATPAHFADPFPATTANSASPASATPAHFANPAPESTATSAIPATENATPVYHPTGCSPTTLHSSACPAAIANTLR